MDGSTMKLEGSVQDSEALVDMLVRALMRELPVASGAEHMRLFELQVRLLSPVEQGPCEYRGQLECVHRGEHVMFGRASLEDATGSSIALATATFGS